MATTAKPVALLGAAGLTGKPLVAELERRGTPVRAVVRRAEQADMFRETRVADFASADQIASAIEGTHAIHYIPPSFNDHELAFAEALLTAANQAGISRITYHSVLHAPTPAMPHHGRKAQVELMLRESDMVWTIIQPAMYTQTCLTFFDPAERSFTPPYAIDRLFNPIDLPDLTEAVGNIITGNNHEFATYELAGSERLTPSGMADVLQKEMGQDIAFRQVDIDAFAAARAKRRGFGAAQTEELVAMYRHYGDFGLPGNGRVLEMILGRPSTPFEGVVRRDYR